MCVCVWSARQVRASPKVTQHHVVLLSNLTWNEDLPLHTGLYDLAFHEQHSQLSFWAYRLLGATSFSLNPTKGVHDSQKECHAQAQAPQHKNTCLLQPTSSVAHQLSEQHCSALHLPTLKGGEVGPEELAITIM